MANNLALVPSGDGGGGARPDHYDELGVELEAMATIGRALDSIEDPALRQRILNWAVERWGEHQTLISTGAVSAKPASGGIASDPALAFDSIDDLFGEGPVQARPGKPPEILVPEKPAAKAPVETMLQSLAADFQRLADEWNGA